MKLISFIFLAGLLGVVLAEDPRRLGKNKKGKGKGGKSPDPKKHDSDSSTAGSDSDPFFDEEEACNALKNEYFPAMRKKMYTKTYNPLSYVRSFFDKAEFGWIRDDEAVKETKAFYQKLGLDLDDPTHNSDTIDRSFGTALGNLYACKKRGKYGKKQPPCTETATISFVLYRMITNKLVQHPLKMLGAFLDQTDPEFRLRFYLHNLQNFMKFDDNFFELVIGMAKTDEKALRSEFINAYKVIIDGTLASSEQQKKDFLKNLSKSVAKTMTLYGLMFTIYQASTYIELNGMLVWSRDNVILYYLNQELILRTMELRKMKNTPLVLGIESKFGKLLGENSDSMWTQDLAGLDDKMLADCQAEHCCPTCKLKAKIGKIEASSKQFVLI